MNSIPMLHATRRRLVPSLASAPLSPLYHTAVGNSRPLLWRPFSSPRKFSTTSPAFSAPSSDDHAHSRYDPPSGWLFGIPPGQKYEEEGWEDVWIYGYWGSLLLATIAYIYKPDSSIQTWALEEARRRLEAEGILEDPDLETES